MEADEIYAPLVEEKIELNIPQLRQPLPCAHCILEETPYVNSIVLFLKESLNRPISVFNKEKYLLFNVCLEQIGAPLFLVSQFLKMVSAYFLTKIKYSNKYCRVYC